MSYTHEYKYFYGKEITEDEIKYGYINYRTLASTFNHILCNSIVELFHSTLGGNYNEVEVVNGYEYDEETDEPIDIYQYYIIDDRGYEILSNCTDEIVYYLPCLDIYIWGVTHFGTAWDGVFTDIRIEVQ